MSTLRILVFRGILLYSEFEVIKPANQQNNAAETSNFAIYAFVILTFVQLALIVPHFNVLLQYQNQINTKT
jgi:hypothetical protein